MFKIISICLLINTLALAAAQIFYNDVVMKETLKIEDAATSSAAMFNATGLIVAASVSASELGYLDGVTSAIQTQLDAKQATIAAGYGISIAANVVHTNLSGTYADSMHNHDTAEIITGTFAASIVAGAGSIAGTYITVSGTTEGSLLTGGVMLSLPQSVATNATPTFAATILTDGLSVVSNTQTTKLIGHATATASVTYQLPADDGSSGNALLTGGDGILYWGAPSAVVSITGGAGISIAGSYTISANVSSPSMSALIVASAYINADGTIGRQDANWITTIHHPAGHGTYGLTFSAGLFSVAPNCQANARDSVSYKSTVGTATTGGINITNANLSATTVASAFTVLCVGAR